MLAAVAGKPEDEDAPDWAQEPEYEDPAEWITASASCHLDRKAEPEINEEPDAQYYSCENQEYLEQFHIAGVYFYKFSNSSILSKVTTSPTSHARGRWLRRPVIWP